MKIILFLEKRMFENNNALLVDEVFLQRVIPRKNASFPRDRNPFSIVR